MTVPERVVGGDEVAVEEVEDLLRGAEPLVLAPQPLGVGGEPLVEPDVAATARRPRLSPNHWWASSWTTTRVAGHRVGEEVARVDRPGLGLQGEAERRRRRRRCRRRRATGSDRRCSDRKPRISGCRANEPAAMSPTDGGRSADGADDPVVLVAGAARGGARAPSSRRSAGPRTRSLPSPVETTTSSTKTPVPGRCRRWRS